ncbi:response regulator [Paraburkholderia fungorum]|uniref:response regulator n=1 Tax=Paraburkholderia fungorum TaxID=134537 RepID=UPI0038BDDE84
MNRMGEERQSPVKERIVKGKSIRVAIADDYPLVRAWLGKAIEETGAIVVGAESNASKLMALLNDSFCDVLITDYSMPDGNALDGWCFLSSVSSEYPDLPVLVYSEFDDPFLVGSVRTDRRVVRLRACKPLPG